jgi:hypothetical protein
MKYTKNFIGKLFVVAGSNQVWSVKETLNDGYVACQSLVNGLCLDVINYRVREATPSEFLHYQKHGHTAVVKGYKLETSLAQYVA